MGYQEKFEYDALGNRVRTVENGIQTAYDANNLNEYTSVRPEVMRDYFRTVQPLIDTVSARAVELGLTAAKAT